MPRAQHRAHDEERRQQVGRNAGSGPADRASEIPSAITDSHLGLTPASERAAATAATSDVPDVIGPGRDDAGLGTTPAGMPPELMAADLTGSPNSGHAQRAEVIDEEPDLTTTPHTIGGDDGAAAVADLEPSLMDQEILADPMAAMGGPDDLDDPVADGDEAYVPPTDPVITNDGPGGVGVLGGFAVSASESVAPARSASDGRIGDEAIADAVRAALKLDATTTDLDIRVLVSQGIVRLRGTVADLDDAENAEAVARRVEGIVDVVEEITVTQV